MISKPNMPKIFLLRQKLQLQHQELQELVKEVPLHPPLVPCQDPLSTWEKLTACPDEKIDADTLPELTENGETDAEIEEVWNPEIEEFDVDQNKPASFDRRSNNQQLERKQPSIMGERTLI